MKGLATHLFLIFLIFSCQKPECNCNLDREILIKNDSILTEIMNHSIDSNFVKYWEKFDKPTLQSQNNESYRFSMSTSGINIVSIYRIVNNNNNFHLYKKKFQVSKSPPFDVKDSLISNFSYKISNQDWLSITNTIVDNCYWTMPAFIDRHGADGANWLVEGFDPDRNKCTNKEFHIVNRWSPDSTEFRIICEKFIALERKK